MGSPKMILPFGKSTVLESVIENIKASEVEKIIVVIGADRNEVLPLVNKCRVMYCDNQNYREGMLSSVKCGIENIPTDFDALMVFLGDQPMIKPQVIDQVIAGYRKSQKGIVIPVFEKRRGHPLLVDKRYRSEIIALNGPEGLKGLAEQHPFDVLEVNTEHQAILRDIDTEQEYLNELNQII
jgi:molybdenum cofactor cytidylyltransferase